uniref:Alcohol oxidase n=1 Tax=Talaromyces marneffei PM1 TaxID=1077442 RepID=A0A093V342_TALMA
MPKSNHIPKEVDIVIAGGGTTGIVVASRLAKADPNLSILILEHGPDVRDNPQVVNPALFPTNLLPGSKTATFYTAEPSEYLNGRQSIVMTGGCLGGGSSINFLVYVRPQEIDFDDWKAEGWSGKEMIPFFKKFENFQDTDPEVDTSIHGYGGELSVGPGLNAQEELQQDFFQACEALGIGRVADVQDFKTSNAVGKWNSWVDKNDGLRQNVPRGFLYPILDAKNTGLQVATEVKVGRILFAKDTNRANGVEYFIGKDSEPGVVYARKQVILAAGALGSPQILERSGVGDSSLLSQLRIPIVSGLPGVGSSYQDHNLVLYTYKSTATKEQTIDGIRSGRLSIEDAYKQKLTAPDRYILGWNGFDCFGKLRPSEEQIRSFAPSLKELYDRDFKDRPEKPMMLFAILAGYLSDHSTIESGQYFSCVPYTAYPYSRGSIHVKSTSPFDVPEFNPGFFSNAADVEQMLYGYKLQREVARRLAHYHGPLEITHPKFPPGSKASYEHVDALSAERGFPVPIEYTAEDDDAIRDFLRQAVGTTWHSMSTCSMKKRLKVVAIGEKAATLVAEELGITL